MMGIKSFVIRVSLTVFSCTAAIAAHAGCFDSAPCDPDCFNTWGIDLTLTNGYRQDAIDCKTDFFFPEDTLLGKNKLKADGINYYQLGLEAAWSKCGWLVRADGDYAWGDGKKYHEITQFFNPDATSSTHAKIKDARAGDFTIGGGFLFEVGEPCGGGLDGLSIGPVAGWSYHRQSFEISHAFTNDIADLVLDNLKYVNQWHGPWVGADLVFKTCYWELKAGYEYHWAYWNASWELDGPDTDVAFSDNRKSSNAHGQLGYVSGSWLFCGGWSLGLGFKYQIWATQSGSLKPKAKGGFDAIGLSGESDHIKHASWESWDVTLNLAYAF